MQWFADNLTKNITEYNNKRLTKKGDLLIMDEKIRCKNLVIFPSGGHAHQVPIFFPSL